ncbi:MAG: DEAD/DEAH box helicase, partial [Chlamydiae bacterium]|nr:DEAD/DEAH box helicase [Chlamydiota bacterium]
LSIYVYHGQDRQVEKLQCACDVIITSYGIVRSDVKIFGSIPFEVVIYDEIQQAKNIKSRTHKALSLLQVTTAIGLTGTPIENHMLELKALFDLLLPHYLPSQTQFNQQFVLPIEKEKDEQARDLLARLVKPFILRRKKSEVLLELPEKTEEIAYCDLSFEQEKLYKQLVSHYQRLIEQDQQTMHIFALFTKLKQLCDHPCLLTGEVHHYDKHTSGKWDLFVELLREARESRQKVVVFTQYLQMLDICKLYLSAQGIGFTEIRGSTRDRKAALEQFRLDPQCEVFLASLQAAGVGIDLTAASVVIHYDRWWNPAKENQATDRVHRMGQSRGVQVFKLLCKHTLEERIHELILKKGKLLDHIVGFDEQDVLKSLTKEELYALFSSLVTDQK